MTAKQKEARRAVAVGIACFVVPPACGILYVAGTGIRLESGFDELLFIFLGFGCLSGFLTVPLGFGCIYHGVRHWGSRPPPIIRPQGPIDFSKPPDSKR